ncbi:MAG: 16S rRNA processing protein RimM [Candidatus Latescibacteria bacterium]|nr:16S rRNA processing protein RimM [Candidatus Latescibacterota bacterium]
MEPRPPQRIAVGYVSRVKGVRGQVKVEPLTHDLSRFTGLKAVVLTREGSPDLPLRLDDWRVEGPSLVMKFAGIDTCEAAREELVKGYLTVAPEEAAPLPPDTFYVADLVGCRVETEAGVVLGQLTEVMSLPTTDAYVVRPEQGGEEFLIPAVGDFVVEVKPAERRVVVRGVEDLLP